MSQPQPRQPIETSPTGAAGRDLTGNHYLAFPDIDPATGAIRSANVLHRGLGGLVSWHGAAHTDPASAASRPLLLPFVERDHERTTLRALEHGRHDRWVPWVRLGDGRGIELRVTYALPGGHDPVVRGGVILLELNNLGGATRVTLGIEGSWAETRLQILTGRRLGGGNRVVAGASAVALEAGHPGAGAALAMSAAGATLFMRAHGDDAFAPVEPGAEFDVAAVTPQSFRLARSIELPAGSRFAMPIYIGIGVERDGAFECVTDIAGPGARELIRRARLDATQRARPAVAPALGELQNRNLLVAYYCGVARAVDDDRLYFVRSRAPDHGACAGFNDREALMWTLPALMVSDPALAREALIRAFEQYSHRAGERLRYVGGAALAAGIALDQICAYPLALDRYVRQTGDVTVLDDGLVQDVLGEVNDHLFARLDPEVFLCRTELLPSGEPADFPYVAFGNALVWAVAEALPSIWRGRPGDPPARFEGAGEEVRAALWQYATTELNGTRVLACATDLRGGAAVYDDPAGSLGMLPYIGFCDAGDPIWVDTMALLRSESYPLWLGSHAFPGLAGRSAPRVAQTAALCSDLLTPARADAIAVLQRLPFPAGIASTGYDPDTGAAIGPFAAPVAGFLAWALLDGGVAQKEDTRAERPGRAAGRAGAVRKAKR